MRLRSTSTDVLQRIDGVSVALMRLLPEKSAHPDDGRRADTRAVVNVTVGQLGSIQQERNVPTLGAREQFGRRAEVAQEPPHILPAPRGEERVAKLIGQRVDVASGTEGCHVRSL